jgi:mono/diheme cytochrome c family protein
MRTSRLAALAALTALAALPVRSQELARGQALYETRCIACHDRSVHQRTARRASDFDGIRREVARWNATAGGEWRAEEIDAVAAYLNSRYYRFPCPPSVCPPAPRAHAPRAPGR